MCAILPNSSCVQCFALSLLRGVHMGSWFLHLFVLFKDLFCQTERTTESTNRECVGSSDRSHKTWYSCSSRPLANPPCILNDLDSESECDGSSPQRRRRPRQRRCLLRTRRRENVRHRSSRDQEVGRFPVRIPENGDAKRQQDKGILAIQAGVTKSESFRDRDLDTTTGDGKQPCG